MSAAATEEPTFSNFRLYRLPTEQDPSTLIADIMRQKGEDYVRHPAPGDWGSPYSIQVYSHRTTPTHPLAAALEKKLGTVNQLCSGTQSLVLFLWKGVAPRWELFAMTTGVGCHVVKTTADYAFPRRVARRLMEPLLLTLDSKPLVGDELAVDVAFRPGRELNMAGQEMDMFWHLLRNFKGCFRADSSFTQIWNGDRPQKRRRADGEGRGLADRVAVEVRGSSLILLERVTMPMIQSLLPLLERIGRGETTFWGEKAERDEMAFAGLDYIAPVTDADLRKELQRELFSEVWRSFLGDGNNPGLTVAPAHHRDYYRANTLRFICGESSRHFSYPPSYEEVIQFLQVAIADEEQEEKFVARLRDARVEFFGKRVALTTLFQGEVSLEGQLYFRVDGMWMEVKGEQLAILQRNFYSVTRRHLLHDDHLPKPWILDPSWVSFSGEGIDNLETVQRATFRFVDEDGTVRVPYVTRCFLDGATHRAKIKRGLDEINALLRAGGTVTLAALRNRFSKSVAKEVLRLLQMERPVLAIEERRVRQRIADASGKIIYPDFANLTWPTYVKRPHLQTAAAGLIEVVPQLGGGIARLPRIKDKRVLETLQRGGKRTVRRFIAQGPHPAVREHHDRYRHVMEEEGYDRLYLGEPGYLVFDQVLGSKAEKVELFDLLYFGAEGELYLYHVKGRFGQQTGAACSQIRTAAQRLRSALMANDLDILRTLCRKALQGGEATPFRAALRKKMDSLPGSGTVEERFLRLFTERKITFVYAFVDGAAEERLLSSEPDPGRRFTDSELGGRLTRLQKEGFLDGYGRVTARFLNCGKEPFLEKFSGDVALHALLNQARSQFNSVYAKVELCEIERELRARDFGFGICQISRHSSAPSSPGSDLVSPPATPEPLQYVCHAQAGLELLLRGEIVPEGGALAPVVTGLVKGGNVDPFVIEVLRCLDGVDPGQGWLVDGQNGALAFMERLFEHIELPPMRPLQPSVCEMWNIHSIQQQVQRSGIREADDLLAFGMHRQGERDSWSLQCESVVVVGETKYARVGMILHDRFRHRAVFDDSYDPRHVLFVLYKKIG